MCKSPSLKTITANATQMTHAKLFHSRLEGLLLGCLGCFTLQRLAKFILAVSLKVATCCLSGSLDLLSSCLFVYFMFIVFFLRTLRRFCASATTEKKVVESPQAASFSLRLGFSF
jgi:hypothetical protein